MTALGRLSSYMINGVISVSAPFHPFGGAVDIIVVEQPDGSFKSSPWYVKFGKFQGVLKTREKIVNIGINDVQADFHMFLDHKGEAFFLKEIDNEEEIEVDSAVFSSPPSSGDETEDQSVKSNKFEYSSSSIGLKNGEIFVRSSSSSRRSRILGLFGRNKSIKENGSGGDGGVERVSSMERAEIAADLLDSKWSTGRGISEEQGSTSVLVRENGSDVLLVQEGTDSCNREVESCSEMGTRCDNEANSSNQNVGSHEGDNDMHVSRACSLDDSTEVISDKSTKNNESDDAECGFIDNKDESEFAIEVPSEEKSHMSKHEFGSKLQCEVEEPTDERVCLSDAGVSDKGSENMLLFRESSEKTVVLVGFDENKNETEAQVHAVDSSETADVTPEEDFGPEYAAIMDNDNLNSIKPLRDEICDEFQNPNTAHQWEVSYFKEDSRKDVMVSYSSMGIDRVLSEIEKSESSELTQEIVSDRVITGRNFQMELEESFKNQSPEKVSFHIGTTTPLKVSPHEIISSNLVNVDEEANSPGVCFSRNSTVVNQDMEEMEDEDEATDHKTLTSSNGPQGLSSRSLSPRAGRLSNQPVENSDDDELLFGELEEFATSGVQCEASVCPDSLEIEDDAVPPENIEDLDHSSDLVRRSDLLPVKLNECYPKTFEALLEESTAKSSPMSIPGSRKCADENVEWTVESLPIFRSHTDSLEIPAVLHPLSHSLDSHSEQLRQDLLRSDISSPPVSEVVTTPQLAEDDSTVDEIQIWEAFRNMSTKSLFEISRCKHELYEGMGSDAAVLVFDTKKVDLENFSSLSSQIMTSDDLIVRVGGRYFPWEAIASCILKMLVLGNDQSFEPEGMIDVERVENSIEGEPLKIEAPSGGSWFWPFGRRRSISTTPAQPIPDVTNDTAIVNSSESCTDAKIDNTSPMVKVSKKKVKSIVPTSEQLAALNLKEGRNVITFTFSTAMLGKQQVDARIYLWKWNTRIVISDVDGTITRSDVLGQFMPLVGKDWSHIGVTHLFSAIKENGYQLLFLSARAISQAHLTRQFLYNLKQDGKTLPDGPVVISPDGLFPSLFREVIRRAPHEFKIACLQDIRALFPSDHNPFYAGFGNRITDEISYLKLGIPKGKIFTINARGEIAVNSRFDRRSYTSLHALVDGMFPARRSAEQEDFNDRNYWRMPLPEIQF